MLILAYNSRYYKRVNNKSIVDDSFEINSIEGFCSFDDDNDSTAVNNSNINDNNTSDGKHKQQLLKQMKKTHKQRQCE